MRWAWAAFLDGCYVLGRVVGRVIGEIEVGFTDGWRNVDD